LLSVAVGGECGAHRGYRVRPIQPRGCQFVRQPGDVGRQVAGIRERGLDGLPCRGEGRPCRGESVDNVAGGPSTCYDAIKNPCD
jgi:hypothetical protein